MKKIKKAVHFDSHLSSIGQIGYAVRKEDRVPAGLCVSEKDLKSFANKTERSIINLFLLMRGGVKFLAMYYVAKKFNLEFDVDDVEFDGYWYKIPVPADNLVVPAAMLFTDKSGNNFISYAIIRDER